MQFYITNRISISSLTVVLHVIWHFNRTSIRPLKNGFLIRLGTVLEYSEFQSYWTIEFQNLPKKLWFRIIPRVPSKVAFFGRTSTQWRSVERSFQNIFCIFCILLIMEWYNIKYTRMQLYYSSYFVISYRIGRTLSLRGAMRSISMGVPFKIDR